MIHFPILRDPNEEEKTKLANLIQHFEISMETFSQVKSKPKTIFDILHYPVHPQSSLSFDIIGDIALVEIDPKLKNEEEQVGEAIMKIHPNVRSVFVKAGPITGTSRVRKLRYLAGENRTLTVHKEHGCIFEMNLSQVFFSPRLSTEHARVASQVRKNESILDMFAGVGPFTVLIAKKRNNAFVNAIDSNPSAIKFLERNVLLNKVGDKVKIWNGDANTVVFRNLRESSDRVIMNHPSAGKEFLATAVMGLSKNGGMIHYYTFSQEEDPFLETKKEFTDLVTENGARVKSILEIRRVRETAPFTWQIAIDAEITK